MDLLLQKEIEKIENAFDITEYQIHQLSELFYKDMKEKTMLKMIHTYSYCNVDVPDGEYLAVDFGGTNLRCYKYEVKNNEIKVIDKSTFSLITENKNYTTNENTLEDIINIIVDNLEKIIDNEKSYFLGYTFSFATRSVSRKRAILIEMAKGFDLREAKDADVGEMFEKVLKERNLKIELASIINDSTATLLTGNNCNKNADIAIIIGTGHNACFKSDTGEIINIESGYMSKGIPLTYYDFSLIDKLKNANNTLLEVLVGGKYLGLIAQEIIDELYKSGTIKNKLQITSKILSQAVENLLENEFSEEEKDILKQIGHIVFKRVAKLVVAEINGILKYIDEGLAKNHCVVFDGTVYEKNKVLQEYIKMYLEKVYGENAKKIETLLIKDASSVGAVISIFPLN